VNFFFARRAKPPVRVLWGLFVLIEVPLNLEPTPLQVPPRSLYLSERRKRPISLSHTSLALEFPSPEWRSCCTFDNTQKP
jgi:hypothetical protein